MSFFILFILFVTMHEKGEPNKKSPTWKAMWVIRQYKVI
ncbi:hypothetical protein O59_003479 [Cellvibrio sp. BR]|nr:hypothetical protein O59_003479 [Cellvibrio sp. BR]